MMGSNATDCGVEGNGHAWYGEGAGSEERVGRTCHVELDGEGLVEDLECEGHILGGPLVLLR